MYVALIQITHFQGIYWIGNYSKSVIEFNNAAAEEYKQLTREHPFLKTSFGTC